MFFSYSFQPGSALWFRQVSLRPAKECLEISSMIPSYHLLFRCDFTRGCVLLGKGALRLDGILLGGYLSVHCTGGCRIALHLASHRVRFPAGRPRHCIYMAFNRYTNSMIMRRLRVLIPSHKLVLHRENPPTIPYYCTHDGKRGSCLTKRHRGTTFPSSRSMISTAPSSRLQLSSFQLTMYPARTAQCRASIYLIF